MNTFKNYLFVICFTMIASVMMAQVGIGTTDPDSSSILDVTSTNKGMLVPRMTETQRDDISLPATGLIIYQTDGTSGLYHYTGSAWEAVGGSSSTTYSVGDFAHGGIVFWVDETGQHGLVCTKSDQSNGVRWYAGTNGDTYATGDGAYAGRANTAIIIPGLSVIGDDSGTYAARICIELQITEGGKTYGDWYLPSKYEFDQMNLNKATIATTALANSGSGLSAVYYWTSTEVNSIEAEFVNLAGTPNPTKNKSGTYNVRAVRAF